MKYLTPAEKARAPKPKDKSKLVRQQYQRYVYARDNGHIAFNKKAKKCDAFFRGDQWRLEDKQRLNAERRPALTINKILPSIAAILGEQLNAVADIGFKSTKDGREDTAEALNKTFIHLSNHNRLSELEADVFEDGVVTSRGYFDVRLNFDENIFGDIAISQLNPRNVVLDPDSEEYDPKSWKDVTTSKWLSLLDIELMWGKDVTEELRTMRLNQNYLGYDFIDLRPDTFGGENQRFTEYGDIIDAPDYRRAYRILERQYKVVKMVDHLVDLRTGDFRPISEDMPREKVQFILEEYDVAVVRKRAEQIKWCVTCNDTLLKHDDSPYRDYTVVPYFPFFRHGHTIGMVENMLGPQEMYNKTRSQELHVINTTANSGWQFEEGQLSNMTDEELEERGAETGLAIGRKPGTPPLEKIQPNQVPTGLDRVSYISSEDLKELSMASDSMRGFDRADVAAKAIQAKSASSSTNFAKVLHNLNKSRMILARVTMNMMQDFYVEERVIQITGGVNQDTEEITINEVTPEGQIARDMTVGKYDVVVTSVPARETHEETQFQQGVQLRELGVAVPDTTLIRASHLADKNELLEEMSSSTEPSPEEQALAELELQIKQLEAQKMEAETAKIRAETAIGMIEAQQGGGGEAAPPVTMEDQIKLAEAKHGFEQDVADLKLKKYDIDENLKLEYAKLDVQRQEMQHKHVAEVIKLRTADRALDQKTDADAGKLKIEDKKASQPKPKPAAASKSK